MGLRQFHGLSGNGRGKQLTGISVALLAITVLLLAAGQIAQKFAAQQLEAAGSAAMALRSMLTSKHFWFAGLLMGAALITWLATLSVTAVSRAYPALALSFIATAIMSRYMLGEEIRATRQVGIVLITLGAALMLGWN